MLLRYWHIACNECCYAIFGGPLADPHHGTSLNIAYQSNGVGDTFKLLLSCNEVPRPGTSLQRHRDKPMGGPPAYPRLLGPPAYPRLLGPPAYPRLLGPPAYQEPRLVRACRFALVRAKPVSSPLLCPCTAWPSKQNTWEE